MVRIFFFFKQCCQPSTSPVCMMYEFDLAGAWCDLCVCELLQLGRPAMINQICICKFSANGLMEPKGIQRSYHEKISP